MTTPRPATPSYGLIPSEVMLRALWQWAQTRSDPAVECAGIFPHLDFFTPPSELRGWDGDLLLTVALLLDRRAQPLVLEIRLDRPRVGTLRRVALRITAATLRRATKKQEPQQ